ncbi:MAG: alpha-ketoacid dehydrogenase subunit beta [Actinobacteria bacterium]|nr:alpha-ketoacid dehydrogenase subunit beta [Actinomycetota bacterium]
MRKITFAQAINEAYIKAMQRDKNVIAYGLGIDDPKGIFGTTLGLKERFGKERVFDIPISENAMTGVAIGAALNGIRPIVCHQRMDFFLLAMDQLVNNAAKWSYMFGEESQVPITIRLIIGRGWGQGPTHSQSLQAWLAHIPGLKVVMPATPYDAKGLLLSSIFDNDPVIYLEHRWLHNILDKVPEKIYWVSIGKARIVKDGKDITIVSSSYMTLESIRASNMLKDYGIDAEIVDLRTIKPLDEETILSSVNKTGRVIIVDGAWRSFGISAELLAVIAEKSYSVLKCAPYRIAFPDTPTPTSWALANYYYPIAVDIVAAVKEMFNITGVSEKKSGSCQYIPLDVPDKSFTGPF